MSVYIDDHLPVVKYNGLITKKPIKALQILYVPQVLGTAATQNLDPTLGSLMTLIPTQNMTINALSVPAGQELYLVVTTLGTTSYTLTFGTNFRTTGPLSTGVVSGKVFTLKLISDGVNFNEVARTTAM